MPKSIVPSDCPAIREVLNRVGDTWSILIIGTLGGETRRFSELRRGIPGISQRMLTLTLRSLERDGLVKRTVYPTIPPKVEYKLTALGTTLLAPVLPLAGWARSNHATIQGARRKYDAAAKPG
jgi:DNA-binding HxlR family transcriptional regulator